MAVKWKIIHEEQQGWVTVAIGNKKIGGRPFNFNFYDFRSWLNSTSWFKLKVLDRLFKTGQCLLCQVIPLSKFPTKQPISDV